MKGFCWIIGGVNAKHEAPTDLPIDEKLILNLI